MSQQSGGHHLDDHHHLQAPSGLQAPDSPESSRHYLTVPDPYGYGGASTSASTPGGSPRSMRDALNRFRKKSVSEISLVLDIMRGEYPGEDDNSPFVHPERAASLTNISEDPDEEGKPSTSKKLHTRRNAIWKQISPNHISRQLHLVQEEKAMQSAPTAPIDATKFVAYVTERRKKRILFKGEYLMILRSVDPLKCQCNVASSQGDRNQYPDTLPYDHTRVVLSKNAIDENSHYINASYVPSWLREKSYVVTQAVKTKAASAEFWRMIWELRSNTIVMLTKVFDFMRVMCLQYWPITTFRFGEIEVETLETKTYAHFVIRTIKLRHANGTDNEERIVKHFHFTEWELNSFPYISAFIELRRRVRQWTDKNPVDAPIVVHCSNGAGRSGAFCALDANLDLLKRTGQIDVFEYAKKMVNSRPNLIDSVDQYIFLYEALAEAVLCNIQPIAMHQLKNRSGMYRSKKDRQLMEVQDSHENKLLLMLTPMLRIGDCAGGHRMENRGKNRDVMVVPPDHARPYLQTLHGESKDYTYINAVEVDGFTRKAEFIVTEWPKQQTVDSFWTLIFDHSCHTVVNLTNQQNSKMYPQFIHNKGKQNYGPFVVEVLNYQQYPAMTSHMVKIQKRPSQPLPLTRPIDRGKDGSGGGGGPSPSTSTPPLYPNHSSTSPTSNVQASPIINGRKKGGKAKNIPISPEKEVSVSKLRGDAEINKLLQIKRNRGENRRELSEQVEKLTFMISEIMATGATQQQLEAEVRICCIIQVRMWPLENKVPLSTSGLIELIKMTRSWRKRAPDRPETKPTIVMSHNGYSRCGIFIGANVCIDQMDMDHEVDVFHAVKMIRINRPQLIDMKDEYKYLYDLMLHWYMTNPEYRIYDVETSPTRETSEDPEATNDGAESLGNGSLIPSNRPSLRSQRGSTKKSPTLYLN